jgi:hypothetical protein
MYYEAQAAPPPSLLGFIRPGCGSLADSQYLLLLNPSKSILVGAPEFLTHESMPTAADGANGSNEDETKP